MEGATIWFLNGLTWLYHEKSLAFAIMLVLLAVAAGLSVAAWLRAGRFFRAARTRIAALDYALAAADDPVDARARFAVGYTDVERELRAPGWPPLVNAWREFHETIIDETETPIRNTARPSAFFARSGPRQTSLIFWSNVFVALGLILTFLGLVAAMTEAAGKLNDPLAGTAALTGLLAVSSAKFLTSIGGIGGSLILRCVEQELSRAIGRRTARLCELLERGLLYAPPQKLAAEQIELMRETRDQLKFFNTDMALQLSDRIGAQFVSALKPVGESLTTLNSQMGGLKDSLGQSAASAVTEAASGELRALAHVLTDVGAKLEGLGAAVGGSGDEAARQIRNAATDFASAAADIRAAFDRLAGRVESLGPRIAEQAAGATRAATDALGSLMEREREARERADAAAQQAADALKQAGQHAAETMRREMGASGEDAAERIRAAGRDFQAAAAAITQTFAELGTRVDAMGSAIAAQGEAASRTTTDALKRLLQDSEAAQRRSAETIGQAVAALASAGAAAGDRFRTEAGESLALGVREARAQWNDAVNQSGAMFRDAGERLARVMGDAAARVERVGEGLERAGDHAGRTADAFRSINADAQTTARALTDAAAGFGAAAQPVAAAADSARAAAERVMQAVAEGRTGQSEALASMRSLADEIRHTQSAAEQAWATYRARFEGLDGAMGQAADKLSQTLADSFAGFRQFASDTDRALADAVAKLAGSLSTIEDYAGELSEYTDAVSKSRRAA